MVSDPLKGLIWTKSSDYSYGCHAAQLDAKSKIRELCKQWAKDVAKELRARLPESSRKAMDLASERGASNWLTSLPIHEFGLCLHKSAFVDAISLRYGWHHSSTPTHCIFVVLPLPCSMFSHVQAGGGFLIIRHNDLRDLTAHLLTEVCHDERTEPDLQLLTGETLNHTSGNSSDGARFDIVNGFCGSRFERTFLDVRVFNPLAASNSNMDTAKCYRKHENEKKRMYDQRMREMEHSAFTPLVFSATRGMVRQATTFYQ